MDTPVYLPCSPDRIICIVRTPGPLPLITGIIRAAADEPGARLITSPCGHWLTVIRPDVTPSETPETPGA